MLRRHDTVDDWPWNRPEVVQAIVAERHRLPPLRFILTTREPQSWLKSHKNFSLQSGHPQKMPEARGMDDETFIQRVLLDHNEAMRSIVPPELLLEGGVGDPGFHERVREFTGYPIGEIPWLNKTSVKVH